MTEPVRRPNPAWDPDVRVQVQRAFDDVVIVIRDVLLRYCDEDDFYQPPNEVTEGGDVTGLIEAGRNQLISRLQDALDKARTVLKETYDNIDSYKRAEYGEGYRPIRQDAAPEISEKERERRLLGAIATETNDIRHYANLWRVHLEKASTEPELHAEHTQRALAAAHRVRTAYRAARADTTSLTGTPEEPDLYGMPPD